MISEAIKKITSFENLTFNEAKAAMDDIFSGNATPAQISAFLIGLKMKGETIDEIGGCAATMRDKADGIRPRGNYIDCVGTGGDGANTFNISTTCAFVISAAGVPVAKHGNRAISSKSGSADVLETLGVNITANQETVKKCVEEIGVGFMFARTFNPCMKYVNGVRGELGIRTIFNILGPLSNPSGAKIQVIGVFDKNLTEPIANAMLKTGIERGMVMSGVEDGLDEFSTYEDTQVSEIKDGKVITYTVSPEQFGIKRALSEDIKGGSAEENAKITLDILNGKQGAQRDIVLLNSAAAIYCGGKASSIEDGLLKAAEAIDSGRAAKQLELLAKLSSR